MASRTASRARWGPRTASRAGRGLGVRAPDAALGLGRPGAPGPGPDPAGIVRDAASSSAAVTSRRVWGMVRAAWAMTAASRLSVLALPGVRSAMRRIDTPRQVAHRDARVSGNRHAPGAPMVAGWSTTTSRRPCSPRRLYRSRSRDSLLGRTLSNSVLPALSRAVAQCSALTDVDADEDINITDRYRHQELPSRTRPGASRSAADPAPTYALGLTVTAGRSPHQRSSSTGPGRRLSPPGTVYGQGQTIMPAQTGPVPGWSQDHQQGNGRAGRSEGPGEGVAHGREGLCRHRGRFFA